MTRPRPPAQRSGRIPPGGPTWTSSMATRMSTSGGIDPFPTRWGWKWKTWPKKCSTLDTRTTWNMPFQRTSWIPLIVRGEVQTWWTRESLSELASPVILNKLRFQFVDCKQISLKCSKSAGPDNKKVMVHHNIHWPIQCFPTRAVWVHWPACLRYYIPDSKP